MRKNGVNGSKEKVLKGVQDMKSRNVVLGFVLFV